MRVTGILRIATLFQTVRYLKPIQVFHRITNQVKKIMPEKVNWHEPIDIQSINLHFESSIPTPDSNKDYSFRFLNLEMDFKGDIDWNFLEYGRLWSYNLNYFEYINQKDITCERGQQLIESFIQQLPNCRVGLEPYPLSLRSINWIQFFIKFGSNPMFDSILYKQLILLSHKKEYHLLGNHLLENGFALLFGSYYFNDAKLYKEAKRILIPELEEQILSDGAHFELSPMYHSIMLFRLLDCYNLVKNNNLFEKELEPVLSDKISLMMSWINSMTFRNGNFPLMNDAAFKIAPTTQKLNDYALRLGLSISNKIKFKESGYRKISNNKFELIVDVGKIGPDYQPGHAHADTFNFEMHVNGRSVIVDTGTSTYEVNNQRFYERSTIAHNTVVVNQQDSSKVWGSHRVGRRANVRIIREDDSMVLASHNGYADQKTIHYRSFGINDEIVTIVDEINGVGTAYFHFNPDEKIEVFNNRIKGADFEFDFEFEKKIDIIESTYAPEFNTIIQNKCVCVFFSEKLITHIK